MNYINEIKRILRSKKQQVLLDLMNRERHRLKVESLGDNSSDDEIRNQQVMKLERNYNLAKGELEDLQHLIDVRIGALVRRLRYHPEKLIESINRMKKYFVYFWRTKKGYDQMRY